MQLFTSIVFAVFLIPFITANICPEDRVYALPDPYQKIDCTACTMYTRLISPITCEEGWVYFNQRCFYKFDQDLETQFSSVVDRYTKLWLSNIFIYHK